MLSNVRVSSTGTSTEPGLRSLLSPMACRHNKRRPMHPLKKWTFRCTGRRAGLQRTSSLASQFPAPKQQSTGRCAVWHCSVMYTRQCGASVVLSFNCFFFYLFVLTIMWLLSCTHSFSRWRCNEGQRVGDAMSRGAVLKTGEKWFLGPP